MFMTTGPDGLTFAPKHETSNKLIVDSAYSQTPKIIDAWLSIVLATAPTLLLCLPVSPLCTKLKQ